VGRDSAQLGGFKNRVLSICTVLAPHRTPLLAAGSSDSTIRLYSLPQGAFLSSLSMEGELTWNLCLASCIVPHSKVHPKMAGPVIVSGCRNTTLRVWKLYTLDRGLDSPKGARYD
jgi:WD40 repeat protein